MPSLLEILAANFSAEMLVEPFMATVTMTGEDATVPLVRGTNYQAGNFRLGLPSMALVVCTQLRKALFHAEKVYCYAEDDLCGQLSPRKLCLTAVRARWKTRRRLPQPFGH